MNFCMIISKYQQYQYNAKVCYMDTYSFIIHVETEDVNEDTANDVEKRFGTSYQEINRPLTKKKWVNET